jgi:hypothetical protein
MCDRPRGGDVPTDITPTLSYLPLVRRIRQSHPLPAGQRSAILGR